MGNAIVGILVLGFIIWLIVKMANEPDPEKTGKILVRKYKSTTSMQRDMERLAKKGWRSGAQTATPGFMTGTRSYTVTYHKDK